MKVDDAVGMRGSLRFFFSPQLSLLATAGPTAQAGLSNCIPPLKYTLFRDGSHYLNMLRYAGREIEGTSKNHVKSGLGT